jgi:serine/threonine protein phosphatase 1
MIIYAISDIHGHLEQFDKALELIDLSGDNKLVLLGDYIHEGPDSYGVLDRIIALEEQYGTEKVIALLGNHEVWALNKESGIDSYTIAFSEKDKTYLKWLKEHKYYYTAGKTIFVHAGVDEEARDMWKFAYEDRFFAEKYPAVLGEFYGGYKIVSGHIGTHEIAVEKGFISESEGFNGILYDGQAHYYIDATVEYSKKLNIIKVDIEADRYYEVTERGERAITAFAKNNF